MIAGHQRLKARLGECITHVVQRLRVVVHDQDTYRFEPCRGRTRSAPISAGHGAGLLGHREREREPGALARPAAFGANAPAVGLDQPLADGQAEPGATRPGLLTATRDAGVLVKQVRQALGRNALAFIGHR